MLLSDKQHQQIHLYLLVLFCFFLPLSSRIAVYSLLLLILNAIVSGLLWHYRRKAFGYWPLFFSSFYLLHLLGMLHTTNVAEGMLDLETKLSFLLLPPILFAIPLKGTKIGLAKSRSIVLKAFLVGCVVATFYAYTCAGILYVRTGLNAFFYEHLAGYVNAHPSYLAIYMIFSLFLLLEKFVQKIETPAFPKKKISIFLILHFLIFIFLLTARMQLIVCGLLLTISLLWYMGEQGKLGKGILIFVLFGILSATLLWNMPHTRVRLNRAYQEISNPDVAPNIRIPIWEAGRELLKKSPWIGYGTGDIQDNLDRLYARDKISEALDFHFNAHNQFLQTAIALGIPGLLWLLTMLLLPLVVAIRKKKYIYVLFLSLIFLSMLTECILETEKGILFYTFFNSFFALSLVDKAE